jgi:recombination protein RecT
MEHVVEKKERTIFDIVNSEQMKTQWQVVLPQCLTAERLARVAITQLRKNPRLEQCSQGSFLSSMMSCAELGLEPNGRHAHLIPYGKECQLIIDYKGLVELAMRSGKISRIHADVVCEHDIISIKNGIITHEITPLKERGTMVGVYAMCFFKDGTEKHEYMSKTEVEQIRKRSRAGSSGPWVSDFCEMAKKTVFRRMSKWLPLSPEVMDKFDRDFDTIKSASATASPAPYDDATDIIPDAAPAVEVAPEIIPAEKVDNGQLL